MTSLNGKSGGYDIFLLRHGDSRRDGVRRYLGQSDDPLNEIGTAQAEWWGKTLSPVPFRRFYCSDLKRCRETAHHVAHGREDLITSLPGLREISMGSWEGLPMEEVKRLFPEEYANRGDDPAEYRIPGGESFSDLRDRVIPLFDELIHLENGPILVVGHAGVNRVLLCHLLGMPLGNLFRLGQDYGCCNLLRRDNAFCSVRAVNLRPWMPVGASETRRILHSF